MRLLDRIKDIIEDSPNGQQQIVIRDRGNIINNRNRYVADWIYNFDNSLRCSEKTVLKINAVNTVITGNSKYKNEILTRQIVAGISNGYIPLVVSTSGKNGSLYNVLRTMYNESAIKYVSSEYSSGRFDPFVGISVSEITEFFYQLVCDFQTQLTNGMLLRNYINVCVTVFFSNGNTVASLFTGELNHIRLLREINHLFESGKISYDVKQHLLNAADSAQSVSVLVLSIIQDYIYKLRKICFSKPTISIRSVNTPRITILGINGNAQNIVQLNNNDIQNDGFNLFDVMDGKCFFLQLENEVNRNSNNSLNEQCFQWYMACTLKMEFESRQELKNRRLMIIIDDLGDELLKWFWWLVELPNSIKIMNYGDIYSKLSPCPEKRQQLIEMSQNVYYFSVISEGSAEWVERTFGNHKVPKVVVTNQPYREWTDIIFPPKSYSYDEIERPWFSSHEVQNLGDMGIVLSRKNKIFKPLYRENGMTYVDRNYKKQKVNFCLFEFR